MEAIKFDQQVCDFAHTRPLDLPSRILINTGLVHRLTCFKLTVLYLDRFASPARHMHWGRDYVAP
jgi:hypothetical protein